MPFLYFSISLIFPDRRKPQKLKNAWTIKIHAFSDSSSKLQRYAICLPRYSIWISADI